MLTAWGTQGQLSGYGSCIPPITHPGVAPPTPNISPKLLSEFVQTYGMEALGRIEVQCGIAKSP